MPSEVRLKKKNRTIKRGPKKLNFEASKPGVRGGPGPLGPPLDPLVNPVTTFHWHQYLWIMTFYQHRKFEIL